MFASTAVRPGRIVGFTVLLLGFGSTDAHAQDAVVTPRRDPSTGNPPIRLLLPGAELRLLKGQPS